MTKDNLWLAVKILLGLPLLFYALLSVLESQKEIWRKPKKKVLVAFLIAWGTVVCFVALVFVWNTHR
jgi:membrane-anchored glycerophosphoryl diester phosphodiesterase (GDPDase)